jgi:hypothetical protein
VQIALLEHGEEGGEKMKYHYKIIGYDKKNKLMGKYEEAIGVDILAEDETEALKIAKKLIKRKEYDVREVSEFTLPQDDPNERRHREWIENCNSRQIEFLVEVRRQHREMIDLCGKANDLMGQLVKATEKISKK